MTEKELEAARRRREAPAPRRSAPTPAGGRRGPPPERRRPATGPGPAAPRDSPTPSPRRAPSTSAGARPRSGSYAGRLSAAGARPPARSGGRGTRATRTARARAGRLRGGRRARPTSGRRRCSGTRRAFAVSPLRSAAGGPGRPWLSDGRAVDCSEVIIGRPVTRGVEGGAVGDLLRCGAGDRVPLCAKSGRRVPLSSARGRELRRQSSWLGGRASCMAVLLLPLSLATLYNIPMSYPSPLRASLSSPRLSYGVAITAALALALVTFPMPVMGAQNTRKG